MLLIYYLITDWHLATLGIVMGALLSLIVFERENCINKQFKLNNWFICNEMSRWSTLSPRQPSPPPAAQLAAVALRIRVALKPLQYVVSVQTELRGTFSGGN